MKNFKLLSILFLSVLISSCSGNDDEDAGSAPPSTFNATITGSSFGENYKATLGNYYSETAVGITLVVTDANQHIFRFFLSEKDGFQNGMTKIIGETDANGYYTNVVIRDQAQEISYVSDRGHIKISEIKRNPAMENGQLISGSFEIVAVSSSAEVINMKGSFKDLAY